MASVPIDDIVKSITLHFRDVLEFVSYLKDPEVLMITITKRVEYAKTFIMILDMRHEYVAFWYMDLSMGLELQLGHSYVTSASS